MNPHGGNIYGSARVAGVQPAQIIDFSASINPLGTPRPVIKAIRDHLRDIEHYPDPDSLELRKRLSQTFDVDPSLIICANGCTELIYLLPRALPFARVLIPNPTFNEYERACKTARPGCTVIPYLLQKRDNFDIDPVRLISAARKQRADALFLCNPNNPTGRIIKKAPLEEAAALAAKVGIYFIIDESFIEFTPAGSALDLTKDNPRVIILRSMTKFYALPGLRLGWGVFPFKVASALNSIREPWSVNTLAQAAGLKALDITDHKDRTHAFIARQKDRLEQGFKRLGIDYVPSHANYYLLHFHQTPRIIKGLKEHNILVRNCSDFTGLDDRYIRVAVRRKRDNGILLEYTALYL